MTSPPPVTVHQGDSPLVLSLPHVGTWIPEALRVQLVPRALLCEDTDWHLQRLYDFARDLGATMLVPAASRYVVDLNRPPENTPMYPGANNTELCPTRFFTGEALYRPGAQPDAAEVAQRVATWWQPYHQALQAQLERVRTRHGHVVLFDAHSIKSHLPWLFEGKLWDLNLGTVEGASCADGLRQAMMQALASQTRFSHVTDGRFKGGYITRHHGRPGLGVHAVQLEMCWSCYMHEEPPFDYSEARAAEVQPLLHRLLSLLRDWRPA